MKRRDRLVIQSRDRFICQACGRRNSGQVHHIRPRRRGGADDPTNLMTLCGRCHMLISPVPAFVLWRAFRIRESDIPVERASVEAAIRRYVKRQICNQSDRHAAEQGGSTRGPSGNQR